MDATHSVYDEITGGSDFIQLGTVYSNRARTIDTVHGQTVARCVVFLIKQLCPNAIFASHIHTLPPSNSFFRHTHTSSLSPLFF